MKVFEHGSEWRRWDLHVHTPDSILESQYREDWEGYISEIESKSNNVSVIGVTDYYSISGYEKMLEYRKNGRLKDIDLLIPNIEFRVTPETESSKGINIHVLVDPSDSDHVSKINQALARLTFTYRSQKYGCEKSQLESLGSAITAGLTGKSALREGMNNFKVSIDAFCSWYESETWLKTNSLIAVANSSKDGASGIRENGFKGVRQNIYDLTDLIFSSNPSDIKHFTGGAGRTREDIIAQYGKIIPCIHGSDAHDFGKIFEPDLRRNCWIKADPSFNGLRQVVFESDRVKIQDISPVNKPNYQVIRRVRYLDSSGLNLFPTKWIALNSDLNTIIGGKSSGKSMLLYHIARTINNSEVTNNAGLARAPTYDDLKGIDFEVEWGNGEVSKLSELGANAKAITYIPQFYINELADKQGRESLNSLISRVLSQNPRYKEFSEETLSTIKTIRTQISDKIDRRFSLADDYKKLQEEALEIGNVKSIQQEIDRIQLRTAELRKISNFTPNDEQAFKSLSMKRRVYQKAKGKYDDFTSKLESMIRSVESKRTQWVEDLLSDISIDSGFSDKSSVSAKLGNSLRSKLNQVFNEQIEKIKEIKDSIPLRVKAIEDKVHLVSSHLVPLESKVKDSAELESLNTSLKREQDKLARINEKLKEKLVIKENGEKCRSEIDSSFKELYRLYQSLCENVENFQVDDDIRIEAKLIIAPGKFDLFTSCFNRNSNINGFLGSIYRDGEYKFNLDSFIEDIDAISKRALSKDAPPLRKNVKLIDAFKHLYGDYFEVDFVVTYKNDDIVKMSPGKRGLVLLSLMLELSNSTHPILIDQPEDNLDNRTIYSQLKDFIRKCKQKRQIILVTHNANLVVAADAECVIVADQKGQNDDDPNFGSKFDYFSGSLELTYGEYEAKSHYALQDIGIREHVCHILEGGISAFKERELKYNLS
ncbi:TrlF family AAA-like ATPase [Rheinheimera soli]|uniref:TrlF family AAA-like ATPase n=1 Tax=Rheinheimera soli TaxID=443616 RepID=UPI001E3ABCCC|nr:hypothetical protein [Rheinheimera soli]